MKVSMKKVKIVFLCAVLSISLTSCLGNSTSNIKGLVAKAEYPKSVAFDDYDGKREIWNENEVSTEFMEAVSHFTYSSTAELLNISYRENNLLYSPISLYMALALSASAANRETQSEILTAMNMKELGVEELEEQTGNLYRLLYKDNKIGKLSIANSLWLDKKHTFKKEYIDNAVKNYYASLYSVDFSIEETGELIGKWISENSMGTLEGSNPVSDIQIMSIINTVYFYDQWTDKFNEAKTKEDIFHCFDGEDVTCDFMNMTYGSHRFIDGEGYTSSSLNFKNSGSMTFYLPDEGIDVYDLISSKDKIAELFNKSEGSKNILNGEVIFKVPKFDFGSSLKLKESLSKMGIMSAFEADADFTNLTNEDIAFISDIIQSTHISIDEKGCEASAYTQIDYCGSAPPKDKAEMILDRPFLFTITSSNGVILFIGIVNNPIV